MASRNRVLINNIPFDTLVAAAKQFNVTPTTVRNRIKSDKSIWKDWCSVPNVGSSIPTNPVSRGTRYFENKDLLIHGVVYGTISEAASALRITPAAVRNRVLHTHVKYEDWKLIPRDSVNIKEPLAVKGKSRTVIINGVTYTSLNYAAIKCGVSIQVVGNRCKSDAYPDWIYKDGIRGNKRKTLKWSCIINGVTYDTLALASTAYNITTKSVYNCCRSELEKWKDWRLCDIQDVTPDVKSVCVCVNGIMYASIHDAGMDLGMCVRRLRSRVYSELEKWKDWSIIPDEDIPGLRSQFKTVSEQSILPIHIEETPIYVDVSCGIQIEPNHTKNRMLLRFFGAMYKIIAGRFKGWCNIK